MKTLAPSLHVVDAPQRFLGLEVGTRMTVLDLAGGLLLCSPIAMEASPLEAIGEPRWVLAPNLFHHLHVGPWVERGLEAWAARGLDDKRGDVPWAGIVERRHPFGDEVEVFPLECIPVTNEVVLLHRPSKTLVTTDLLFNLPATAPWSTRTALRLSGAYPGCRCSVLERVAMKRDLARRELSEILDRDFDRVILTHGEVVETGGKEALRRAYAWLGL